MSDSIGKPPAASHDDLLRPEAGFHDDRVGGQLKAEEAARRRAAEAKGGERPRRIIKEPEQVSAASSFRPAQQETPEAAQIRRQRALVAGQPPPARGAERAGGGGRGAAAAAQRRLEGLFGSLAALAEGRAGSAAAPPGQGAAHAELSGPADHRRIEALGERAEDEHQGGPAEELLPQGAELAAPNPSAAAGLPSRLAAIEQQARYHLQALLAGHSGLVLQADPVATFAELFAALPAWPRCVPPGRVPTSADDFDMLVAWVFAPHALEADDLWLDGP